MLVVPCGWRSAGDLTTTDLLQLASLSAPVTGITSLSGLELAANLAFLDLQENQITDVSPVRSLTQLTFLNLSYNPIRDVPPLAGLTNLTTLLLRADFLQQALFLEHMPSVTALALADNHISDLTPLRNLTNLRHLELENNPISTVAPLCELTNLADLYLGGVSITNAACVSCFTRLTSLSLPDNYITDLTPLLTLTNLHGLGLDGNPISDWSPLAALTNLDSLSVCGNSLTNLNWLTALGGLHSLWLSRNYVTDLSPLAGLTNLSSLDVSQNPARNYSTLASLTNLEVLYLCGNGLADLSFAADLRGLQELDLVGNSIADLTPVADLTNLLRLDVSLNLLTNISALEHWPELQTANLQQNLLDLAPGSEAMDVIQTLQHNGASVTYQPQLAPPQILVRPQWLLAAGQRSWLTFLLIDDASFWQQAPMVVAHSSNPNLLPESLVMSSHFSDLYFWDLALTPAIDQAGTATLTLAVTNYAGLWTNVTLQIQIQSPSPFDGESLDSPALAWSTTGDPPWFSQNAVSHDGLGAAQSGATDSTLQTTVTGPGTLRFWFKLQSDYYYTNAQLSATSQNSDLHGSEDLHRQGEIWQPEIVGLPAGEWVLKWSPSWDNWSFGGSNMLWLDQVSFVPGPPACRLELPPNPLPSGERELYLHGALGQNYAVEVPSDLRHWSSLTQVTCENFELTIRDWDVGGLARFYRARALP
jgi:Leucine-rich repeat (LRR) protein